MLANGRNRWRRAGVTGIDHFARPVGVAGRLGRGADAGAEVENVRPDRVGLRGHRCRTVEHRLEWKLTSVAHDPDWPGLGDLSLEPVAFAAVFTGDGHSHRPCRVALPLRRTTPPHVATRILASNESPTSFTPRREEGVEAPAANRLRGRLRRCALATGERSTPSPAAELAGTSTPFLPPVSAGPVSFGVVLRWSVLSERWDAHCGQLQRLPARTRQTPVRYTSLRSHPARTLAPVRATTRSFRGSAAAFPTGMVDSQVTRRPVGRRRVSAAVPPGGTKGEA